MLDRPSHGLAPPNTHAHTHVQVHTCTPAVPPGSEPLWQETQSCSLWSVSAEHLLRAWAYASHWGLRNEQTCPVHVLMD